MSQYEPNMALYYLVLRGWLAATGSFGLTPDELLVRVPSVFFAVLGVVVVFWIGRRFCGRTVGVVGAVVYLLKFIKITKKRAARSHSPQRFLLCLNVVAPLVALSGAP